jgi:glycosyltransferase involved in cell wall biosynthesis
MFVVPNLGGGGAERTMLDICTHLDRASFEPVLVVGELKGSFCPRIPRDVLTISLDRPHVRDCIWVLARTMRVIKPDVVLSALTHMNVTTIAAHSVSRSRSQIIVREESVYDKYRSLAPKTRQGFMDALVRVLYKKARRVVFVSNGAAAEFESRFPGANRNRYQVMYNPVDIESIARLKQEPIEEEWWPLSRRTVISVGRLSQVKGYTYLLEAMQIVSGVLPDTRLVVLGCGEEEERLREYSTKLGLHEAVRFAGFRDNPFKYMARSSVFVLSSIWEGFGNVIVEAMACGVPVISTDCPYGPGEIIENEVSGILVPARDSQALAAAILRVLQDPGLARRLVENGAARAREFDVRTIVGEYEALLRESAMRENH